MQLAAANVAVYKQCPESSFRERQCEIRRYHRLSVPNTGARNRHHDRRRVEHVVHVHAQTAECLDALKNRVRIILCFARFWNGRDGANDVEPQLSRDLLLIPEAMVDHVEQQRDDDAESQRTQEATANEHRLDVSLRTGGREGRIENCHVRHSALSAKARSLVPILNVGVQCFSRSLFPTKALLLRGARRNSLQRCRVSLYVSLKNLFATTQQSNLNRHEIRDRLCPKRMDRFDKVSNSRKGIGVSLPFNTQLRLLRYQILESGAEHRCALNCWHRRKNVRREIPLSCRGNQRLKRFTASLDGLVVRLVFEVLGSKRIGRRGDPNRSHAGRDRALLRLCDGA